MGERPNVHAEVLLGIGRRYGDACVAHEAIIKRWRRGDPMDEMQAASAEHKEAEVALLSAARAYATRMRHKVNETPSPTAGGPGAGTADGAGMEGE